MKRTVCEMCGMAIHYPHHVRFAVRNSSKYCSSFMLRVISGNSHHVWVIAVHCHVNLTVKGLDDRPDVGVAAGAGLERSSCPGLLHRSFARISAKADPACGGSSRRKISRAQPPECQRSGSRQCPRAAGCQGMHPAVWRVLQWWVKYSAYQ